MPGNDYTCNRELTVDDFRDISILPVFEIFLKTVYNNRTAKQILIVLA